MSNAKFTSYEKHLAQADVLGQHKSVLLKNPHALKLVCQELALEDVYDDLEYAAQHGHILIRSRLFLHDKKPEIRSGLLAVINKNNLSLFKLFAHNHRQPEKREQAKLVEIIDSIFRQAQFAHC